MIWWESLSTADRVATSALLYVSVLWCEYLYYRIGLHRRAKRHCRDVRLPRTPVFISSILLATFLCFCLVWIDELVNREPSKDSRVESQTPDLPSLVVGAVVLLAEFLLGCVCGVVLWGCAGVLLLASCLRRRFIVLVLAVDAALDRWYWYKQGVKEMADAKRREAKAIAELEQIAAAALEACSR